MTARGYPMATWDQRASDVWGRDHPEVVANYRAGHDTSLAMEAGKATTEQLRKAMVHYRTLFEDLLAPEPEPVGGQQLTDADKAKRVVSARGGPLGRKPSGCHEKRWAYGGAASRIDRGSPITLTRKEENKCTSVVE